MSDRDEDEPLDDDAEEDYGDERDEDDDDDDVDEEDEEDDEDEDDDSDQMRLDEPPPPAAPRRGYLPRWARSAFDVVARPKLGPVGRCAVPKLHGAFKVLFLRAQRGGGRVPEHAVEVLAKFRDIPTYRAGRPRRRARVLPDVRPPRRGRVRPRRAAAGVLRGLVPAPARDASAPVCTLWICRTSPDRPADDPRGSRGVAATRPTDYPRGSLSRATDVSARAIPTARATRPSPRRRRDPCSRDSGTAATARATRPWRRARDARAPRYRQAAASAAAQSKLLLIYLHSALHEDAAAFCRDALATPDVERFCRSRFVLWGADVESADGHALADALRATRFPFLALVVCRPDGEEVLERLCGAPCDAGAVPSGRTSNFGEAGPVLLGLSTSRPRRRRDPPPTGGTTARGTVPAGGTTARGAAPARGTA